MSGPQSLFIIFIIIVITIININFSHHTCRADSHTEEQENPLTSVT